MKSSYQLVRSPMLVILMDPAAGWTSMSLQNLLMILSKKINPSPSHFFLSQVGSCNHQKHTTVSKLILWWHAKTWEKSEPEHTAKKLKFQQNSQIWLSQIPLFEDLIKW